MSSSFPTTLDDLDTRFTDDPDVVSALRAVQETARPGYTAQAPAFASTITPDPRLGAIVAPGALTGDITIANPPTASRQIGRSLTIIVKQDGTGGRKVTWGTDFKAGSAFGQVVAVQATLAPAEVLAITTAEQELTVPAGLFVAGDLIVGVSKPTTNAGVAVVGQRLISATKVGLTFVNATAGAVTPTAEQVYTFAVIRQSPQPALAAAARSAFTFVWDGTTWTLTALAAGL